MAPILKEADVKIIDDFDHKKAAVSAEISPKKIINYLPTLPNLFSEFLVGYIFFQSPK